MCSQAFSKRSKCDFCFRAFVHSRMRDSTVHCLFYIMGLRHPYIMAIIGGSSIHNGHNFCPFPPLLMAIMAPTMIFVTTRLNDYTILRNDTTTENNKSKLGEMPIVVKSETKQKVNVTIKVISKDDSKLICCF